MYLVLGIEPFKQAQVYGSHSKCCQRYAVKTLTEVKKEKLSLFM